MARREAVRAAVVVRISTRGPTASVAIRQGPGRGIGDTRLTRLTGLGTGAALSAVAEVDGADGERAPYRLDRELRSGGATRRRVRSSLRWLGSRSELGTRLSLARSKEHSEPGRAIGSLSSYREKPSKGSALRARRARGSGGRGTCARCCRCDDVRARRLANADRDRRERRPQPDSRGADHGDTHPPVQLDSVRDSRAAAPRCGGNGSGFRPSDGRGSTAFSLVCRRSSGCRSSAKRATSMARRLHGTIFSAASTRSRKIFRFPSSTRHSVLSVL
jgi:hypothetical protein